MRFRYFACLEHCFNMKNTLVSLLLLSIISCKSLSNPSDPKNESEVGANQSEGKGLVGLGLNDITVNFISLSNPIDGIEDALPRFATKPEPEKFAPGLPAAPLDGFGLVFPTARSWAF
jgi:hypothetical protein